MRLFHMNSSRAPFFPRQQVASRASLLTSRLPLTRRGEDTRVERSAESGGFADFIYVALCSCGLWLVLAFNELAYSAPTFGFAAVSRTTLRLAPLEGAMVQDAEPAEVAVRDGG